MSLPKSKYLSDLGGLLDASEAYLKAEHPEHLRPPYTSSDALLAFLGEIAVAKQAWDTVDGELFPRAAPAAAEAAS